MSKILSSAGDRLREELERCGVSHLARVLGVARNTLYNWAEKGNVPVDRLAALGDAGVDIAYVLTGERAALHAVLSKVSVAAMIANRLGKTDTEKSSIQEAVYFSLQAPQLTQEEQQLLDHYRAASPAVRPAILAAAASLAGAAQSESKPKRAPRGKGKS